jgi:hypothetical protein
MKKVLLAGVVLLACACLVAAQAPAKKRVAILVDNSTPHPELTGAADANLSNAFVKTGRFEVIERAQLDKVMKEQALGMTGALDAVSAAKVGNILGVNDMVLAKINEATFEDKSWTDKAGKRYPSFKAAVGVDLRIVDTETASIILSELIRKEKTTSTEHPDQTMMMTEALTNVNKEVQRKVWNAFPAEGYVIAVKDLTHYTLDLGKSLGIDKGAKIRVVREGAPIKHPVTGAMLPGPRENIAELEVESATDLTSEAKITKWLKDPKNPSPLKVADKVITMEKGQSFWDKMGEGGH